METRLLPETTSASLINAVHCADLFDLCERVYRAGVRVDMVLADLPYGTTACSWDTVIPFEPMWAAFKRIIKPRGAIVLTASQPFTSVLICSNLEMFRCEWIWNKTNGSNPALLEFQPFKIHESVCVFSQDTTVYFPQMEVGTAYTRKSAASKRETMGGGFSKVVTTINDGWRYPKSIIEFSNADQTEKQHPTQKPTDLFRYLIRTYTRPGELVFDPVVGSGTTAVAAREEGRRYIVGDSSADYCTIARNRLAQPFTPSFLPALDAAAS